MEKKLQWTTTLGGIGIEERLFKSAGGVLRPFSETAGVRCRGYSLLLQRRITDFGSEKSFDRAARQMDEHYGLTVGASTVRRITQDHGEQLHGKTEWVQGTAEAQGSVAQIIVETDGTMIPTVTTDPSHQGDKRTTRQVGWKEARLGLAYEQGIAEPIFGVTTGSVEQAGNQLGLCAARIGIDASTRVHGVGDGAPWIADQTERVFGARSGYLIDFYHLCDYLAAASKSCAANHQDWYTTQKAQMKAGELTSVLATLVPHIEPPDVDDSQAPVRACHRYIHNRPEQFDYPKALQAGLPIGSGKIESAHRYVIQQRLKIPGAWWKIDNADKMLALRTARANGNWKKYWDSRKAA